MTQMESKFQSGLPPEGELKLQEEAGEQAVSHFPGRVSQPPVNSSPGSFPDPSTLPNDPP